MSETIQTDMNIKNINAVNNMSEPMVSAKDLSAKMNKELDDNFINNPTAEEFYSTKKANGALYPLFLIKGVKMFDLVEKILNKINRVSDNYEMVSTIDLITRDTVVGFYLEVEGVAKFLTKGKVSLDLLNFMDSFILDYVVYLSKGVKYQLNREDLIDPEEFNPKIIQENNIINYSDINKDVSSNIASMQEFMDLEEFYTGLREYNNNLINSESNESSTESNTVKDVPHINDENIQQYNENIQQYDINIESLKW